MEVPFERWLPLVLLMVTLALRNDSRREDTSSVFDFLKIGLLPMRDGPVVIMLLSGFVSFVYPAIV